MIAATAARCAALSGGGVVGDASGAGAPARSRATISTSPEATSARIAAGRGTDPESKEGEIAALFVRAFRSLDAVVGGNEADARAWMHAPNRHLGGVPAERVLTLPGLVHVVEYLDAVRGKL